MDRQYYDPTFLWLVTYFSSAFIQGKTVEEIAIWGSVFTVVGDQLALIATEISNCMGSEENQENGGNVETE